MSKMHLYPMPEQNALDVFAHLDPLAGRQRARPRARTGKQPVARPRLRCGLGRAKRLGRSNEGGENRGLAVQTAFKVVAGTRAATRQSKGEKSFPSPGFERLPLRRFCPPAAERSMGLPRRKIWFHYPRIFAAIRFAPFSLLSVWLKKRVGEAQKEKRHPIFRLSGKTQAKRPQLPC